MNATAERGKLTSLVVRDEYPDDIDAWRRRYGKAEGERAFYEKYEQPKDKLVLTGNLFTFGGCSALFDTLIGGGSVTVFSNANAYLGVGDSSTAAAYTQTDLQASSNKVRNAVDASYPLHTDSTAGKTITGATNVSPISVTATSHGYSTNDIVNITGVGGNTAANSTWQITVVDANTFTLNGSTGNGSYTSGGLASKANVCVFKSTFGTSVGNFAWNEWGVFNASSSGRMLNRSVVSLGTKTSAASWALTVAPYLT